MAGRSTDTLAASWMLVHVIAGCLELTTCCRLILSDSIARCNVNSNCNMASIDTITEACKDAGNGAVTDASKPVVMMLTVTLSVWLVGMLVGMLVSSTGGLLAVVLVLM